MSVLDDPRVAVDEYIVLPSCVDRLPEDERMTWALCVKNGHRWGWSVREARFADSARCLDREGEWVWESRGHEDNKHRRWDLEEAMEIALKYVDSLRGGGRFTAQEFADFLESKKG